MESTNGSVSIEASISLPIYVIVLLTFIYLMHLFNTSDDISFASCNALLNNIEEEYVLTEDLEPLSIAGDLKLKSEIENDIKSLRIKDFDVSISFDDEFISLQCNYKYVMPFKLFDNGYLERSQSFKKRKFQKGMSLEDYNIVSRKIDAGFDVWELSNFERAQIISKLLGGTESFNGNGIDKIENGKAVAIVSLDFRKNSYIDTENITNKILDDLEKIINFRKGYVGDIYVTENSYTKKVLELAIPDVEISPELESEFIRIKQIASNAGVGFKITQIGGD